MTGSLRLQTLVTLMRRRPVARVAALALVLMLLPAGGCKHSRANPSQPLTKDERSQQSAIADPDPAPDLVPVRTEVPHFAVQVAAFDRRDSAEALASRLSGQLGFQTLVEPVEVRGVTFYRVRLLVENKDQADSVASSFLRNEKLKVWIVPLP